MVVGISTSRRKRGKEKNTFIEKELERKSQSQREREREGGEGVDYVKEGGKCCRGEVLIVLLAHAR